VDLLAAVEELDADLGEVGTVLGHETLLQGERDATGEEGRRCE
jgi:hypothetical protein